MNERSGRKHHEKTPGSSDRPEKVEYLEQRGIDVELARKAGWLITENAQLAAKFCHPKVDLGPWCSSDSNIKTFVVIPCFKNGVKDTRPEFFYYILIKKNGEAIKGCCEATSEATRIRPWFSPLNDWSGPFNSDSFIYLCESPLKALLLSILGYHAIGLNGVRGYQARAQGHPLLPELLYLPAWAQGAKPVFVTDADIHTNADVQKAARVFAELSLSLLKQPSFIVRLPNIPGHNKDGVDDYRQRAGTDALRDYLDHPHPHYPDQSLSTRQLKMGHDIDLAAQQFTLKELLTASPPVPEFIE